jgi:pimeloyl-ACP methyl ester carboxylesterase
MFANALIKIFINLNLLFMKKIFVFFVLLTSTYITMAQTLQLEDTILVTRDRWRDTCFGLINKSSSLIPSGYLLDYSLTGFSEDFDGVGSNDTLKTYGDFFYYHNILELSKVNSNAALQLTNDLFINAKRYKRDNPSIPLLFLFQPYQKINANALSNNLFSITADSVRLMDVPNRPSSPYDNKQLFMFTSIQTNITQHGNISFSLPSTLWQMAGINSVSIDFGDGLGSRTIAKGGTASVYYATEGYKSITAVISTSNGSRTAKCRIKYSRPQLYLQADTTWNISVTPVYTDESSYLGQSRPSGTTTICNAGTVFDEVNCDINLGAEVRVINGCDQVFDKPIIIVEGFDTDNSLDIPELFRRFSRYLFIDNMRSAGHDFVFVNFKKPTDFIENNAKVLEAVINQVNATKAGNIRGSVIGYSMGGLVARWCLKDMEDRSIDHRMAHYFSYDAPHQGANIPLGLQYLFGEIENDLRYLKWRNLGGSLIVPQFYQLAASAQSAAAKQMLVTKGNYNNGIFNWNPTLNTLDPVRAAFAQRLLQKGYPRNLTRHGIAFGRGNNPANTKTAGNGNQFGSFAPGSKIFDGNITLVLVNLTSSAYAVPENNTNNYICRYRFLGYKVVRIFGVNVGTLPTLRVRNFKYTGQYPYDDAPGSYETTQSQFVDQFNPFNGFAVHASNQGHHGHNFASSVSALDMRNQGYSATNKWQSNNLFFNIDNNIINPGQVAGNIINPALSPFNDVLTYTSDCGTTVCQSLNDDVDGDGVTDFRNNDWNQFHNGFISRQASQFIQRKILNAVPGTTCPGICNNANNITGSPLICTNEIYQLTGPNPVGLNINWESENGRFQIITGQGTRQITATRISSGTDFVRVTLTNGCGATRVIRIPITVGAPQLSISSSTNGCNGSFQIWNLVNNTPNNGTNWLWTVSYLGTNSQINIYTPSSPSTFVSVIGGGTVSLSYTDLCGVAQTTGITVYNSGCSSFAVSVSPNPAQNNINVSLAPVNNSQTSESNTPSEVVGSNGKTIMSLFEVNTNTIVKQWKYNESKNQNYNLNINGLRKGIYLLQVDRNNQTNMTKIIIE